MAVSIQSMPVSCVSRASKARLLWTWPGNKTRHRIDDTRRKWQARIGISRKIGAWIVRGHRFQYVIDIGKDNQLCLRIGFLQVLCIDLADLKIAPALQDEDGLADLRNK